MIEHLETLKQKGTASDWRRLFLKFPAGNPVRKKLYYAYIQSVAWLQKRRLRYKIDKGICAHCGKLTAAEHSRRRRGHVAYLDGAPMGAHEQWSDIDHKTYSNLGDENIAEDLQTLCRSCHQSKQKETVEMGWKRYLRTITNA